MTTAYRKNRKSNPFDNIYGSSVDNSEIDEPVLKGYQPSDDKPSKSSDDNYEVTTSLRRRQKTPEAAPVETLSPSTFNNLKDNIFYNILLTSHKFIPKYIYIQPGAKGQQTTTDDNKTNDLVVYGLNMTNFTISNLLNKYFQLVNTSESIPNVNPGLLWNVFKAINANRNIMCLSQYRAVHNAQFANEKSISDAVYQAILHILSYVHNGAVDVRFNNVKDITRSNDMVERYTPQLENAMLYHNYTTFNIPPKNYPFPAGKSIIEVNKILSIPDELHKKLWKISKYFPEIKEQLTFNESNGYYCYKVEDVMIPILCIHEYMALDGQSLELISLKCYLDGKCKYCSQEISAYHNLYNEDLPPIIYSIILRFIDTILDDIDVDGLNVSLFDNVYAMITRLRKTGGSFTEQMITALTALYLYKVYLTCKSKINFNPVKTMKYNDAMTKYCAAVGWSGNIINSILNDDKYLPDTTMMVDLIKGFSYTTNIKYTDTLMLSILFNKGINPLSEYKLEPTTELQKLYVAGKIPLLTDALMKARAKLWDMNIVSSTIDKIKEIPLNCSIEKIRLTVIKNGQTFWDIVHKWYCPVSPNNMHKNDKGACKYCGYKSDGSNKQFVYDKYQIVINNQCTLKPQLNLSGVFTDKTEDPLKNVDKYDPTAIWKQYVIIKDHSVIETFDERMNNEECLNNICKYITSILHVQLPNKITADYVKKCLCYIVDSKRDSSDRVLDELKYIIINVKDHRMIVAIINKINKEEKTDVDDNAYAPLKF